MVRVVLTKRLFKRPSLELFGKLWSTEILL
jgi:hypothetical protein